MGSLKSDRVNGPLTEHYEYRMVWFTLDRNDIMGSRDPGMFTVTRFIEIHCVIINCCGDIFVSSCGHSLLTKPK